MPRCGGSERGGAVVEAPGHTEDAWLSPPEWLFRAGVRMQFHDCKPAVPPMRDGGLSGQQCVLVPSTFGLVLLLGERGGGAHATL